MPRPGILHPCKNCKHFAEYSTETRSYKDGYGFCCNIDAEPSLTNSSFHPFRINPTDTVSCNQYLEKKIEKNKARAAGKGKESKDEEDDLGEFQRDLQE